MKKCVKYNLFSMSTDSRFVAGTSFEFYSPDIKGNVGNLVKGH